MKNSNYIFAFLKICLIPCLSGSLMLRAAESDLGWEAALSLLVEVGPSADCEAGVYPDGAYVEEDFITLNSGQCMEGARLLVTIEGMVEKAGTGYDVVSLNGQEVFSSIAKLDKITKDNRCDMDFRRATVAIDVAPGDEIRLKYDTISNLYHLDGYAGIVGIIELPDKSCKTGCGKYGDGFSVVGWSSGSSASASTGGGSTMGLRVAGASAETSNTGGYFFIGLSASGSALKQSQLLFSTDPMDVASALRRSVIYVGAENEATAERIFDDTGKLKQVKLLDGLVELSDIVNGTRIDIYEETTVPFGREPGDISYGKAVHPPYVVTNRQLARRIEVVRIVDPVNTQLATLRFTQTEGNKTAVLLEHSYNKATKERFVREYDAARITFEKERSLAIHKREIRTKIYNIVDGVQKIYSDKASIYQMFDWGESLIEETVDPDGLNLKTTYSYYDDMGQNYSRLQKKVEANGHWEVYKNYAGTGVARIKITQFHSNPLDEGVSGELANRVNRIIIDKWDEDGDGFLDTITEYREELQGITIRKNWDIEYGGRQTRIEIPREDGSENSSVQTKRIRYIQALSASAGMSDSSNLVTNRWLDVEDGAIVKEIRPGNMMKLVRREKVRWNNQKINPFVTNQDAYEGIASSDGRKVVSGKLISEVAIDMSGNKEQFVYEIINGRKKETTWEVAGVPTVPGTPETKTEVIPLDWREVVEKDPRNRPLKIAYGDGSFETFAYGCCGVIERGNRDGSKTIFVRDGMMRDVGEKVYVGNDLALETMKVLDPLGRVVKSGYLVNGTMQWQEMVYDMAGRITLMKDELGRTVSYTYTQNGNLHTETHPDGGTKIETYEQDGTLSEISGTAVAPRKYVSGADAQGAYQKEIFIGVNGEETEWKKTTRDLLGRVVKITYPDGAAEITKHDERGQVIKQVDADGVTQLFSYDEQGRIKEEVIDSNANGVIDHAGADFVRSYVYSTIKNGDRCIIRREMRGYLDGGEEESKLLQATEAGYEGTLYAEETDAGRTVYEYEVGENGLKQVSKKMPNGTTLVSVYGAGLLKEEYLKAGENIISEKKWTYDTAGRMTSETVRGLGTADYTYYADGQMATTTMPAAAPGKTRDVRKYRYNNMGFLTEIEYPDASIEHREYYKTGWLKKINGGGNYPQEYAYDSQGRMNALTTWKNFEVKIDAP